MKKLLLTLSLSFFITAGFSQSDFSFGLRFNPMLSWFKAESNNASKLENNGASLGFSYGIMADYFFTENYAFATELRFAHYGGKTKENFNGASITDATYRLQYLQLPISLKMRTNEIGMIRYFGQFGFIPSFNTSARGDFSNPLFTVENTKINDNIRLLNTFLLIGGGLEYSLGGSTAILVGVSFENGFMNIRNKKDNPTEIDLRSKVVALNLGVKF